MTSIRPVTVADAAAMATLAAANRDYLAPRQPARDDEFFTEAGQRTAIQDALTEREQGTALPEVILDEDGRIVGRISLNAIVTAKTFLSASVGFWVGTEHNGRGHATAALREIVGVAFNTLGLHRVQAETLVHNERSQYILEKTGFVRYGLAPRYLRVAGSWQDCVMFQILNERD